jgi:hypothetical protein
VNSSAVYNLSDEKKMQKSNLKKPWRTCGRLSGTLRREPRAKGCRTELKKAVSNKLYFLIIFLNLFIFVYLLILFTFFKDNKKNLRFSDQLEQSVHHLFGPRRRLPVLRLDQRQTDVAL